MASDSVWLMEERYKCLDQWGPWHFIDIGPFEFYPKEGIVALHNYESRAVEYVRKEDEDAK